MRHRVLLLLLAAPPVFAHDTWLLPEHGANPPGAVLRAWATSGMAFPKTETAIKPERIDQSGLRVGSAATSLDLRAVETAATRFEGTPSGEGVATLWIATRPRTLELNPEQVAEYLQEIEADDDVRPRWEAAGRRWRETYVKVAKAQVAVGAAGAGRDESWAQPVGLPLELVAEANPVMLRAGGEMAVRLLWQGRPVAGLAIHAEGPGVGGHPSQRTDADGRARFTMKGTGPCLLKATRLRPAAGAGGDWDSVFTTLTVYVGAVP